MRSAYVLSFTQWGLLAWSTYVITKRALHILFFAFRFRIRHSHCT